MLGTVVLIPGLHRIERNSAPNSAMELRYSALLLRYSLRYSRGTADQAFVVSVLAGGVRHSVCAIRPPAELENGRNVRGNAKRTFLGTFTDIL